MSLHGKKQQKLTWINFKLIMQNINLVYLKMADLRLQ